MSEIESDDSDLVRERHDAIRADQIRRARPGGWLNDRMLNAFMDHLQSVYGNNCLFLHSFVLSAARARERRSTSRLVPSRDTRELGDFRLVLFPFHRGSHWTLVAADLVKEEIRYYDSLAPVSASEEVQEARNSVLCTAATILAQNGVTIGPWELQPNTPGLPQQSNGSDCGVFVCRFAQLLARGDTLSGNRRCTESEIRQVRERIEAMQQG